MGQFYVYENPNPRSRGQYPCLLDIQSHLLSELSTTLVIPLTPSRIATPVSLTRLNLTFFLDGESFTAMTKNIAGIERKHLGAKVYDLNAHRTEAIAAVDFVLSGI